MWNRKQRFAVYLLGIILFLTLIEKPTAVSVILLVFGMTFGMFLLETIEHLISSE